MRNVQRIGSRLGSRIARPLDGAPRNAANLVGRGTESPAGGGTGDDQDDGNGTRQTGTSSTHDHTSLPSYIPARTTTLESISSSGSTILTSLLTMINQGRHSGYNQYTRVQNIESPLESMFRNPNGQEPSSSARSSLNSSPNLSTNTLPRRQKGPRFGLDSGLGSGPNGSNPTGGAPGSNTSPYPPTNSGFGSREEIV